MFCSKCGNEIKGEESLCSNCGNNLININISQSDRKENITEKAYKISKEVSENIGKYNPFILYGDEGKSDLCSTISKLVRNEKATNTYNVYLESLNRIILSKYNFIPNEWLETKNDDLVPYRWKSKELLVIKDFEDILNCEKNEQALMNIVTYFIETEGKQLVITINRDFEKIIEKYPILKNGKCVEIKNSKK